MTVTLKIPGVLAIIGGIYVILFGTLVIGNIILFAGSAISGLLMIIFGSMLYKRPVEASVWGMGLVAVSIIDVLGAFYFLYAPGVSESSVFLSMAGIGPVLALIGAVAALLRKPAQLGPLAPSNPA